MRIFDFQMAMEVQLGTGSEFHSFIVIMQNTTQNIFYIV